MRLKFDYALSPSSTDIFLALGMRLSEADRLFHLCIQRLVDVVHNIKICTNKLNWIYLTIDQWKRICILRPSSTKTPNKIDWICSCYCLLLKAPSFTLRSSPSSFNCFTQLPPSACLLPHIHESTSTPRHISKPSKLLLSDFISKLLSFVSDILISNLVHFCQFQ